MTELDNADRFMLAVKTRIEHAELELDDLETMVRLCRLMKAELVFQAQPFVGNNGVDFDYTARATRMQEKAWECLERVNQICRGRE